MGKEIVNSTDSIGAFRQEIPESLLIKKSDYMCPCCTDKLYELNESDFDYGKYLRALSKGESEKSAKSKATGKGNIVEEIFYYCPKCKMHHNKRWLTKYEN